MRSSLVVQWNLNGKSRDVGGLQIEHERANTEFIYVAIPSLGADQTARESSKPSDLGFSNLGVLQTENAKERILDFFAGSRSLWRKEAHKRVGTS